MPEKIAALTRQDGGFGEAKTHNSFGPSAEHFLRTLIAVAVSDDPAADNAVWVHDPKGEWDASLARDRAETAHLLSSKPPARPRCSGSAKLTTWGNSAHPIDLLNLTIEPFT